MSLVGNWQKEAARFAPSCGCTSTTAPTGCRRGAQRRGRRGRPGDHHLRHRATGPRQRSARSPGAGWSATRRRTSRTARDQAGAGGPQPARAHRIALTGTPVENHLAELWSIMEFLNPGLLGPAETFRKRYAGADRAARRRGRDRQRLQAGHRPVHPAPAQDRQDDHLRPAGEAGDEGLCTLTAEQATLYQAVVTDMLARIEAAEGIERRGLVLATMTKLKQVCNHPAHLLEDGSRLPGRSGKLARLEEICEEILAERRQGAGLHPVRRVRLGCCSRYLAARLGRPVLCLHGGTAEEAARRAWSSGSRTTTAALFLLSLKAGGTGPEPDRRQPRVHFDRWWNPAVEDQATDRAFRIGQRRNVQVRKFVCVGTLEEQIDAMIEREEGPRRARSSAPAKSWLTELSTDELRKLSRSGRRRCPLSARRPVSSRWPVAAGRLAERSRPRQVDGGIRARSKRGTIGEQWWSRRFIDVLEPFCDDRAAGPRPHLRPAGQVLGLDSAAGLVDRAGAGFAAAAVPGPHPGPAADAAQWHGSTGRWPRRPLFRARLLAGEMPPEIEEVFAECGHAAVPARLAGPGDVLLVPGLGVPCKHLAAVSTCWPRRSTTTRSWCWPGAGGAGGAARRAARPGRRPASGRRPR